MNYHKLFHISLIVLLSSIIGCKEVSVPKPVGYFRIDLPEHKYLNSEGNKEIEKEIPLSFEYPAYGILSSKPENIDEPGWFNIEFPAFKAKIYLTYKNIGSDFDGLMEQTYKMNVKNHIGKADAINEQMIVDEKNKIYGILYDLKGSTATSVQFYLTDSINHYLRGSLYFSAEPNADSLAPVINFFREDIIHMIETLKWKEK